LAWTLRFDPRFERDLRKLDRGVQRRIVSYLEQRVAPVADPKSMGHALSHDLVGHWRYRVGDYRIICRFEEAVLVIVAVAVGHRSTVYDR
jgi:mRNA interferase RelE/StbE